MAVYHDLPHPRKISEIVAGEIAIWASSDGGTTWYPLKVDILGGLLAGGTSKTIITAPISIAALGDNEIVVADGSNKIKVVTITFTMSAENDLIFKHGATAYSGQMAFAGVNEPKGMTANLWPFPMETAVNEAFIINLGVAAQVSGFIQYFKEA